ncbi:MAG: hypothetical protein RBR97_15610 [Bacteroidales bacterium]|nr:hypothetical protein [Bacteroidales bacterium]
MKKRFFLLGLVLVMFVSVFTSCKKYEDGPLLSLKSKNARLNGEWELVSYSYVRTSDTETTTTSYDGTTMTTPNSSYLYSHTLLINSDGTYTYKETRDGYSDEYTAYWSWFDGAKGKQQIMLYDEDLFAIKKLTNKELILESNYSWIDYGDSVSTAIDSASYSYTWTYQKK